MEECIAAISTARGASGVAVIRLSGENCLLIAEKMFHSKIAVRDFEPNKMYVGTIRAGELDDRGMCVFFKAPKSFTGEDCVEFHCHGGSAITEAILNQAFELGARPARNGEFTKRAFVNGKLSLSAAEGLIEMINAESRAEAKCGYYLYREKLLKKINAAQDELTNVLAQIDVEIDFPEDDIDKTADEQIQNRLIAVLTSVEALSATYKSASKAKSGIKVAIVGRPNSGKSSILNAILKCDRAIVAPVEGTTRDVVEGTVEIGGINYSFFDTAGIRESDDIVEKIGVERSLKAIDSADIAVQIVDAARGYSESDELIAKRIEGCNHITVLNKIDLNNLTERKFDARISALTGEGIEELKKIIYDKTASEVDLNGDFITEERHYFALKAAEASIKNAIAGIGVMPTDIVGVDVREAWLKLGEISGSTSDQTVIDEIFAKFCVGK